jgi:hypothetical protein
MTQLLHRLAARAAGTAVQVRSDARLAYGADNLAWRETSEDRSTSAIAQPPSAEPRAGARETRALPLETARDERPAMALQRAFEIFEARGVEPRGVEPASHRGPQSVPPARDHAEGPAPLTKSRDEASKPSIERLTLHTETDGRRFDAGMQREPVSATPREQPGDQPRGPPELLPDSPSAAVSSSAQRPSSESRAWPHRATSASVRAAEAPHPEAANAAAARVAPLGSRRAAPAFTAPRSQADEATEVHIHIGRIEVTAVREQARVRSKQAAEPASLSLDAYLATRSRA